MSLDSQQYGDLSSDSYNSYRVGIQPVGQEETVELNGISYKILEHASNSFNGYQGTIYQRMDTGDIIVAHRGTEVPGLKGVIQDALFTDGSMALDRVNPQEKDAIELTRRAIERAEEIGKKPEQKTPEVTVTGHSLGGCLTQITAHHFDLKGETFNAYGAISLGLRIPEGGDKVINHVMAGDTVSSASAHYGSVKVYASEQDMVSLMRGGYDNNRNAVLDNRSPILSAGYAAGSHSMHQFTRVNGAGQPDRSILSDPDALTRANDFDPMIDKFRSDIMIMRKGMTLIGRGPINNVLDGIEALRDPLDAGEPAERAALTNRLTPTPPKGVAQPQPYDSPLFGPDTLPDFPAYVPKPAEAGPGVPFKAGVGGNVQAEHAPGTHLQHGDASASPQRSDTAYANPTPDAHALTIQRLPPADRERFGQAMREAQRLGLPEDDTQRLAMVMTAKTQGHSVVRQIHDSVLVSDRGNDGGDRLHVMYKPYGDKEPIFNDYVNVKHAIATPVEDTLQQVQRQALALAEEQRTELERKQAQEETQGPVMKIGGRTIAMSGDGNEGNGGEGGGDGGGAG